MKFPYAVMIAAVLVGAVSLDARAAAPSDARVQASIRKSYVFAHYLKNDEIKIVSRDGAVTLTGSVSAEYHRELANEAAAAQTGVKSVDDQLAVRAPAPSEGSDEWLSGKVKAALLFHRNVSALETTVVAKNGVVTLTGRADGPAEKDLATEYARAVDGVSSVDNEMTVAAPKKRTPAYERAIDDASVTAEVKVALLLHRSTSAVDTQVATTRGVVTLTGKATSMAEKDLTERIVSDIRGVKSVKNDLIVQ